MRNTAGGFMKNAAKEYRNQNNNAKCNLPAEASAQAGISN